MRLMANHSFRIGELVNGRIGEFKFTNSPIRQLANCMVALVLAAASAHGQTDRARTEAAARRATERLQALQREADQLVSDERTLLNDLRRLEVERQIKTEDVKRIAGE